MDNKTKKLKLGFSDDSQLVIGRDKDKKKYNDGKEANDFPDKSVTDEVSQILSSMPETATNFNTTDARWIPISQPHCLESGNQGNSSAAVSSSSEDDDEGVESEVESSELDEGASATRRVQCVGEMNTIEKQFFDLKDQLYKVRHSQITKKLSQLATESEPDYLRQLEVLRQQQEAKLQVASTLRNLHLESLEVLLKAEKQSNAQHLANDKSILVGKIQADLDERMRRLEEDRDNVDSELWNDVTMEGDALSADRSSVKGKKNKKKDGAPPLFSFGNVRRKKKAVVVTGPYIVYMLRDADVLDDWAAIKRAVNVSQRRSNIRSFKKRLHSCKFEDGRLVFGGRTFSKGQSVAVKNFAHPETRVTGTIISLSPTEVVVRQSGGSRTRLSLHQLQRGRFALHHR